MEKRSFFIGFCVVALIMFFYALYYFQNKQIEAREAYYATPSGVKKKVFEEKLMSELPNLKHGTILLGTDGEVYLFNRGNGKNDYVYLFSRFCDNQQLLPEGFVRLMDDYYIPGEVGQRARERAYLLEMFVQGRKISTDWKNNVK